MNIQHIKKGALEYALVTDVYSKEEVSKIKEEIVKLHTYSAVNNTGSAVDSVGNYLNHSNSLWMDDLYSNREESDILTFNRKLFSYGLSEQLAKENQFFSHIRYCNIDCTLINYYSTGTEYRAHRDRSILTALTFFSIGEFTGGDLEFVEFKEVIKPIENTMVIFPGCVEHRAHPVVTNDEHSFRISIAQFINYVN